MLAAEYVVGLLDADERQAVEARMRQDPAFSAQVDAWENYFAGLNDGYGTTQPSAKVKTVIDQRLFPTTRSRPRWWGWAGLAAAVLAVAVILGTLSINDGDGLRMVAQLESSESVYRFAVEIDDRGNDLDIALTAGPAITDRTFELWLIPEDGAPQSLGTFAQAGRLQATAIAQMQTGAVLAVSLEPPGGSPTGAPTGPVLAVGTLSDA